MYEKTSNLVGVGVLALCFAASLVYVMASSWPASGKGIAGTPPVTIRFAHQQLEGGVRTALDQIAAEYMKIHPGVRVEQLLIPERIFPSWLITQLVGDTAPDIIQTPFNDEQLARFYTPLTDRCDRPNPYNAGTPLADVPLRDTFFDGMRGGFSPNLFEYYGVPISNGSVRMYYNLDLLREITGGETLPGTYEELIALCRQAQAYAREKNVAMIPIAGSRQNAPIFMGNLFSSQTQKLVESLSGPGEMPDPTSRATDYLRGRWSLDTPGVRSGFTLMREVGQFMQPGFMQLQRDDSTLLFAEGRALMIPTGNYDVTSIRQQASFRLGVALIPLPSPDDPAFGQFSRGAISELGNAGPSFGLTRHSPHPDIAWDFLLFLSSQRMNQLWTDTSGWLPSVVGVKVPADIAIFLPRADGYMPGLYPSVDEGSFPDVERLYVTNLHTLVSPYGSVDAFLDAIRPEYAAALTSDLKRNVFTTLSITQRSDTQLAAIAWQSRTHPGDAAAARRFDSDLQAAAVNDRKYDFNRRAYQTAADPHP